MAAQPAAAGRSVAGAVSPTAIATSSGAAGLPPMAAAGATAGAVADGGRAGAVGGAGAAGASAAGAAADSGGGAAAGSRGVTGGAAAGSAASGGDITSICMGGEVGKDSDNASVQALNVSREYGAVKYLSAASNPILSLKTTLIVPKVPTSKQTLFIWPGLQCRGASDPARIGNGILQPVLTWGPSCAPKAPQDSYSAWWMAAMYVNVSSNAAGSTGCAGGDYMMTEVGDELFIDMSVKGDAWTQTITNMRTMKSVDLASNLKGQVQNWATWAVEVPTGETIKPSEDVVFTQSVLTFMSPVTSCQPNQAGGADYYSAPVLSPDGLHCCYDKIILRAQRN